MSPTDLPADHLDDDADPADTLVTMWRGEIERYAKSAEKWVEKADKIVKRYRAEQKRTAVKARPRYNILWANTETMLPAVYAQPPQPVVQRPFRDRDPIGRIACRILERALTYQIEAGGLHETVMLCVQDKLLPGRGTCWLRYEPSIEPGPMPEDTGGEGQTAEEPPANEQIADETVHVDYVHWRDFAHEPARVWKEVTWVARRVYMDRQKGVDRFGQIFRDVPLTFGKDRQEEEEKPKQDEQGKAGVWEIWNRAKKEVIWIADDFDQVLDQKDDPYHLQDFFPCPAPLYATTTTDTLIPVPDSVQYESQMEELDLLTMRIDRVTHAIKVRGAYALTFPELSEILKGDENDMIPINEWDQFAAGGGMKGSIDFVPIDMLTKALEVLHNSRDKVKSQIDEISGLSDILRGQGDAAETATAVNAKGRFATLRLKRQQDRVAHFARNIVRIMAELICELFQPDVLAEQASCQEMDDLQIDVPPPAPMPQPGPMAGGGPVPAPGMPGHPAAPMPAQRMPMMAGASA